MDKLMIALGKYLTKYIPEAMGMNTAISVKEDKDGDASIVFFLNKKEIGRTKPRPKQEVEDYLTYILYSPEVNDLLVGSASDMLCFVTFVILKEIVHAVNANGLFDKKTGEYYPAMMLDEMFMEIHEALNG